MKTLFYYNVQKCTENKTAVHINKDRPHQKHDDYFCVKVCPVIIFGLRFAFFTHISGKKRTVSKYVR